MSAERLLECAMTFEQWAILSAAALELRHKCNSADGSLWVFVAWNAPVTADWGVTMGAPAA